MAWSRPPRPAPDPTPTQIATQSPGSCDRHGARHGTEIADQVDRAGSAVRMHYTPVRPSAPYIGYGDGDSVRSLCRFASRLVTGIGSRGSLHLALFVVVVPFFITPTSSFPRILRGERRADSSRAVYLIFWHILYDKAIAEGYGVV